MEPDPSTAEPRRRHFSRLRRSKRPLRTAGVSGIGVHSHTQPAIARGACGQLACAHGRPPRHLDFLPRAEYGHYRPPKTGELHAHGPSAGAMFEGYFGKPPGMVALA